MLTRKEARSIIRKGLKRVAEGEEVRHLNIMPMMDIMTILLVAFILTASESAALTVGDVNLPGSQSTEELPEGAVALTIARTGILVDGGIVVKVTNGAVDASEIANGAMGLVIPRLSRYLGDTRRSYDEDLIKKGKKPPIKPELLIIGDKSTPYKLLFEVILSSRHDDAGFRRFRLILLEQNG